MALRRDLECCVTHPSGSLEVDEGWRTLPYLGEGSAGIGMVLDDYLALGADTEGEFERARAGVLTAAYPAGVGGSGGLRLGRSPEAGHDHGDHHDRREPAP